MEPTQANQAGQAIWSAWEEGRLLDELPEACRPQSAADAYRIQRAIVKVSGDRVAGWKLAATGPAAHSAAPAPPEWTLARGELRCLRRNDGSW